MPPFQQGRERPILDPVAWVIAFKLHEEGIQNVYDSVKFLSDVMSFISALGCSGSLWPVWPVPGTGLTGLC